LPKVEIAAFGYNLANLVTFEANPIICVPLGLIGFIHFYTSFSCMQKKTLCRGIKVTLTLWFS
jgi:hypothetical protein